MPPTLPPLPHTLQLEGPPSVEQAADWPLVCSNLTRHFGSFVAVKGIDLAVPKGAFLGFLGPNGAGKSTTIHMIIGLLKPTRGQIHVDGHPVQQEPLQAKAALGVIPEDLALYDRLTAREQIEFTGRMFGINPVLAAQRADEMLELLELDADRFTGELSLGMRKKVALACALIHDPPVLVLDEPFNGIDAVSARLIKLILKSLARRGTTIVLTTHVMEQVESLCDHIAVIHQGTILASGTMEAFRSTMAAAGYQDLEHAFVALVGRDEPERGLSWI